jgi:predicted DNA-binding transcriptional regulator AlpA
VIPLGYSPKELCERYRCGRSSIWRWTRDGLLPVPVKIGRNRTIYLHDEIIAAEKNLPRATYAPLPNKNAQADAAGTSEVDAS